MFSTRTAARLPVSSMRSSPCEKGPGERRASARWLGHKLLAALTVPTERLLHAFVEAIRGPIAQLTFRLFDAEIEVQQQELELRLRDQRLAARAGGAADMLA